MSLSLVDTTDHAGRDWRLVAAMVACGTTSKNIAAETGVGLSNVRKWRVNPKFKAYVNQLLDEGIEESLSKLAKLVTKSLDKIDVLLDSKDEHVVLKAVGLVIDLHFRHRDQRNLADRLAALEANTIHVD